VNDINIIQEKIKNAPENKSLKSQLKIAKQDLFQLKKEAIKLKRVNKVVNTINAENFDSTVELINSGLSREEIFMELSKDNDEFQKIILEYKNDLKLLEEEKNDTKTTTLDDLNEIDQRNVDDELYTLASNPIII